MKYKTVPGVVLTASCDRFFLVSSKNTIQVNDTTAFYWSLLEKGASKEELFSFAKKRYEIESPEELKKDIDKLLSSLISLYFVERHIN